MEEEQKEVIGARAHNLKDISLTIPRNKLVVLTMIFRFRLIQLVLLIYHSLSPVIN